MSPLPLTNPFKAAASRLAERRLDAVSEHTLPWSWADAGGLYYGEDGAWLYQSLPLEVMATRDRNGGRDLTALLHHLATTLGRRELHLLSHAWEEPATVPPALPEPLHDHLEATLRMFVPARGLILGVKLAPAPDPAAGSLRRTVTDTIDRALGENVPQFEQFDADREQVSAAVEGWGGRPVSGRDADHLESWYALGTALDLDVTERDDVIYVSASTHLETVTVRSFPENASPEPRPLFSAGAAGATVISVRGTLATKTDHRAGVLQDPTGTLTAASIVIGRRSTGSADTLAEACEALPGVEVQPLPLRQIPGLEETLPCSRRRMNPHLHRVTGADLARAGLAEPTPAGDATGLFLGLAAPDFAYPCYLNPAAGPGQVALLVGMPGSGKTFLAEHLALQASLANLPLTYLSEDGESGRSLVGSGTLRPVTEAARGCLDPFGHMNPQLAADVVLDLLPRLVPQMSSADVAALQAGLRRAVAIGATSLTTALSLLDDQAAAARLVRFTSRHPLGRLLLVADAVSPSWAGTAVSVPHILRDIPADDRAAAEDLLAACVVASAPAGAVVVVDGLAGPLTGSATAAVTAARAQEQVPGLTIVTGLDGAMTIGSALARQATTRVALNTSDPDAADAALTWVGLEPTAARRQWLRTAGADVDGSVVFTPARALILDRWKRTTSFIVGPVPAAVLPRLTRHATSVYAVDVDDA